MNSMDDFMPTDEVSLASVTGGEVYDAEPVSGDIVPSGGMELFNDMEEIEELSEEAKKRQEQALLTARERAMSIIDRKKLPLALKEINGIEMASQIFDDTEVLQRVKDNISSTMDLKFLAEWQKIRLQNLQTLMRMDSVDTNGTAGEVFVGVEFGSGNGGTTKVVVGKR